MNNPYPVRTFKGNRERVNCVAFHPDTKQIASGSDDSSICLWNIEDSRFSFKLIGHKGPVKELSYSLSGNIIASASKDNTIKIWSNKYDGSFSTLRGHDAGVNSVQFFNEGANLISASDDKSVLVWDQASQEVIAKLQAHLKAVNCVRVSHDQKMCISGSDDGLVKLWNIERCTDLTTFNESRCIYGVRFNPESNCLATCGEDSFIRIHDIRSRFEIKTFLDHQGASTCVDFHPSQPVLLTAGEDAKVRMYDLRNYQLLRTINANHIGTNSVTFSKHGDYFGCGGEDKMVMVWKSNLSEVQREFITQANENIRATDPEPPMQPKSHIDRDYHLSQINHIKKVTNMKSANGKTIYNQKHPDFPQLDKVAAQGERPQMVRYVISEDLGNKLDKINSNLDMINKSVEILSHRIGNSEKALDGVIEYLSQKYNTNVQQALK